MTLAYGGSQPCDQGQLAAGGEDGRCPERDRPWVLATAILGSSLAFIEGSVVNLALPALQRDFGVTSTELQWVVNAYLLALGAFMLIGGSAGDRFGLRRVFALGTAVFAAGALLSGLAPDLGLLIAARSLQGLGGALLVPASLALISTHFPRRERGKAIGTWAGASALTTALGPVLGGWLVDSFSWRAVFFIVPPLAALAVLLALARVPPAAGKSRERLDYAGALLLAAALGCLIAGLVAQGGIAGGLRLAFFTAAVGLGAAFLWWERRAAAPMLPLALFRSAPFSGANAMTLLLYCALSGTLYFLPFNLIQVQGYSALQAGAAFLPMTLILGLGSRFAGDQLRRIEPRILLTVGPVVAGAGFAALGLPGADASYLTGFLPAVVVIGLGMTASVAPLTTVVMDAAPEERAGVASGINNTASRLAGVLAVAALTAVAIAAFSDALGPLLARQQVDRGLAAALLERADRLAELAPPEGTGAGTARQVREAVDTAFLDAFRTVTAITGLLAAASGLVAWLTVRPSQEG